jgi:hypothetical protein
MMAEPAGGITRWFRELAAEPLEIELLDRLAKDKGRRLHGAERCRTT